MNKVWEERRTKKGLAARQYSAIQRQMRRHKNDPLPQTFTSRGVGGVVLTVRIGPLPEDHDDEIWEDF